MNTLKTTAGIFFALALTLLLQSCGGDPRAEKIKQTLESSDKLLEQKEYEKSLETIRDLLKEEGYDKEPAIFRQMVKIFLKSSNPNLARNAYEKLIEVSPEDPILRDALKSQDKEEKLSAVRAIGMLRDPKIVDALLTSAKDQDIDIRKATVIALGDIASKQAVPILIEVLKDEDWLLRGDSALALGKISDPRAVPPLFDLLNDPDQYVRDNALQALQGLATDENKQAFTDALQSDSVPVRLMAASALANKKDPTSLEPLIALYPQVQNREKLDVIRALVRLGDPNALPLLRDAVKNEKYPHARILAILALAEFKDKESLDLLKTLSKNNRDGPDIRLAAIKALNIITN